MAGTHCRGIVAAEPSVWTRPMKNSTKPVVERLKSQSCEPMPAGRQLRAGAGAGGPKAGTVAAIELLCDITVKQIEISPLWSTEEKGRMQEEARDGEGNWDRAVGAAVIIWEGDPLKWYFPFYFIFCNILYSHNCTPVASQYCRHYTDWTISIISVATHTYYNFYLSQLFFPDVPFISHSLSSFLVLPLGSASM